jgi:hypothetical protein
MEHMDLADLMLNDSELFEIASDISLQWTEHDFVESQESMNLLEELMNNIKTESSFDDDISNFVESNINSDTKKNHLRNNNNSFNSPTNLNDQNSKDKNIYDIIKSISSQLKIYQRKIIHTVESNVQVSINFSFFSIFNIYFE